MFLPSGASSARPSWITGSKATPVAPSLSPLPALLIPVVLTPHSPVYLFTCYPPAECDPPPGFFLAAPATCGSPRDQTHATVVTPLPSHCSGSTGSLTSSGTRELLFCSFLNPQCLEHNSRCSNAHLWSEGKKPRHVLLLSRPEGAGRTMLVLLQFERQY